MAMTVSPTIRSDDVPSGMTGSGFGGSTLRTARSCSGSRATTRAGSVVPSGRRTRSELHVVDDVVVGDDVAAGVDDDAGAHAVDAAAGCGATSSFSVEVAGVGDGPLAVDVDDRRLDPFDHLHGRRTAGDCRAPAAGSSARTAGASRVMARSEGGGGPDGPGAGREGRRRHGDPRAGRRAGADAPSPVRPGSAGSWIGPAPASTSIPPRLPGRVSPARRPVAPVSPAGRVVRPVANRPAGKNARAVRCVVERRRPGAAGMPQVSPRAGAGGARGGSEVPPAPPSLPPRAPPAPLPTITGRSPGPHPRHL